MKHLICHGFAAVLLGLTLLPSAQAAPATAPTKPSATSTAKAPPTSGPVNAKGIAEQLRKLKQDRAAQAKVAYFDLTESLLDRPLSFTLFPQQEERSFWSLIERLKTAQEDDDIKAVLVTLRGADPSLAQALEIRNALRAITRAGKPVFVYADSFETSTYLLATGGSEICLMSGGEIMIPGVGLQVMFARGLLDKVGVQADFVQVGEYKGADEALTRTSSSEKLRGELTSLADSLYSQVVQLIAEARGLKPEAVKQLIDEAIIPAQRAKERRLVDRLCDLEDLRDEMGRKLNQKVDLVRDYGVKPREGLDLSNPFGLLALLGRRSQPEEGPGVGVLYVTGTIVDGNGEEGLFTSEDTADGQVRRGMRMALRDPSTKAVVIRIDSPGGSALASEAAWQAIRRVAREKPVIVSIGGMAASGGYYIASAGDYIYADSTAIVGSIGVVGGKVVLQKLLENIGVNTESFTRGANAALFSSTEPFSDGQRQMLRKWMEQTYSQFLDRVLTTRKGKIQDIDQVARGRIFLAPRGKELGMVDAIGGLDEAIAYAASKASLAKGAYEVRQLPAPRTLGDILAGTSDAASPIRASLLTPGILQSLQGQMSLLPPTARRAVTQQLSLATLLDRRPVVLLSPWCLTTR